MNGMSSHQSARMLNDEWLTPPDILKVLGKFDLDPCAPVKRPWDIAENHYSIQEDGLKMPWFGRVFCNPPYGLQAAKWLEKLSNHNDGIALIFARTETRMFFKYVWDRATAILFIEGRLYFHFVDGSRSGLNAGAPSVLVAYGINNAEILKKSGIKGKFLYLKN